MKRIIIVHGWGGNPDEPILLWLANKCEELGYEVIRPTMPNSETPVINVWINFFKDIVGGPDKDTYFIGHSIGCQTIMRYFETLPQEIKVGGAVFVAGWFNLDNLEENEIPIAKPWIETTIDFKKIKFICQKISVFLSSNEPFGCVQENKKIFEEKLNAEVIILENKGHFSGDDGIIEFPEALNALLKMME